MSADLGELSAKLTIDSTAADVLQGKLKGLATSFGPVGIAAIAVSGAVIGIGALALDLGAKYQTTLSKIQAQMGITAGAAKAIGDAFLSTGGSVTFTAEEIASAFAPVSAQLDAIHGSALTAAQSLGFMNTAMALAEATGSDLTTTTATLATVLQTFQIGLGGAAQAADDLYNASKITNNPIDSLAGALEKLRAKLGPLGGDLGSLTTLFVDLAEHGVTGSRALMAVSTAVNTLLSPTKSGAAEIKKLGLNMYDASGNFVGFQSIIAQLAPKLATMTEKQRILAENTLFGKGAFDKFDATLLAGLAGWEAANTAATATGTAQAGAKTATDNAADAWKRFTSHVTDMLTQAGTPLQNFLKDSANWLNAHLVPAVQWLTDHFNVLGPVLTGIVAGFAAWKIAMLITGTIEAVTTAVTMLRLGLAGATIAEAGAATGAYSLGVAFTAMLGPIGLVIAAIAVATAGMAWLIAHPGPDPGKPGGPAGRGAATNPNASLGAHGVGDMGNSLLFTHGASGGELLAGHPYWVGEEGPEPFFPKTNGTLLPNNALAGAGGSPINIVQNYHNNSGSLAEMQAIVRQGNRDLMMALRSH
jgi:TP901 family phage tail tape measure protein